MIQTMFFVLAQAGTPTPQQSPPGLGSFLVPMICIGVIFYFLIIRPQNQKQKQHQALMSSMKTGDKIVTSGGIHGLISNVKDATVIVKVADNVKLEIDKAAIATVFKRAEEEPAK